MPSNQEIWEISETFIGYFVHLKLLKVFEKNELKQVYEQQYVKWRKEKNLKCTSFSTVFYNLRNCKPPYLRGSRNVIIFQNIEEIEYLHRNILRDKIFDDLLKRQNEKSSDNAFDFNDLRRSAQHTTFASLFDVQLAEGNNGKVKEEVKQHIVKYIGAFSPTDERLEINLKATNRSQSEVNFKINILRNSRDFTVVGNNEYTSIRPTAVVEFSLLSNLQGIVGISTTDIQFEFLSQDGNVSKILQIVEFQCNDDDINNVQESNPIDEYVPCALEGESNYLEGKTIYPGIRPAYEVDDKLAKNLRRKRYTVPRYINEQFAQGGKHPAKNTQAILKSKLSNSNYDEKFHLLLYIEELQNEKDMDLFKIKNAFIHKTRSLMKIEVHGLAEKRPSVLRGDKVYVSRKGEHSNIYEGFVDEVHATAILVGFGTSMLNTHIQGMRYTVHFTINRNPMNMMHRAIDLVYTESRLLSDLFPRVVAIEDSDDQQFKPLRFFNRALEQNQEQSIAVTNIVRKTMGGHPYIIFGPPGTGKTVTMVEAVKQVLEADPNGHIILCAPSNSTCDLLTDRLMDIGRVQKQHVFRLSGLTRDGSKMSEAVRSVSNYDNGECYFPPKTVLMTYRVIICTPITAGRLATAQFPRGHFTDMFLDEAGYCMEPEFLVTIGGILSPNVRIVLAGDFQQLGPIVHSNFAKNGGLDNSLLKRLVTTCELYFRQDGTESYNNKFITKLLDHHRFHEAIIKPSNELFYHNELRYCSDKVETEMYCHWKTLPTKDFPILFHGVQGNDEREKSSPSYFNTAEIAKVMGYVEELLESRKKLRVMERVIGIISPYHKQVSKINKALSQMKRKFPEWSKIKVGSVEEFQGQERGVIIISTVRSNTAHFQYDMKHHLGFLRNPQRFNVAMTRAKSLLIIIGNPRVLNADKCWRHILKYCVDHNAYRGLPDPLAVVEDKGDTKTEADENEADFEPSSTPWWNE